jgi:hypothetical protein
VGEELGGALARAVAVGVARERLDERPDVRDDGELAVVEQRLQLRERRVQAVLAAARGVDGEQTAGEAGRGQREAVGGARAHVFGEALGVHGDDRVVAVVAAVQEDADEGFVVGGGRAALREGVDEAEVFDARDERRAADERAARLP